VLEEDPRLRRDRCPAHGAGGIGLDRLTHSP
jgi:hypothetical protein